jgi:sugar lactone lactonase YvrE
MEATMRKPVLRRIALPILMSVMPLALAVQPAAATTDKVIVLPGATSAEGITAGRGTTFYAGDLFGGDIFRGDIRTGTASLFIDAPAGRMAVGMDTDHDLLFVAGGSTGAHIYNLRTAAPAATYQFGGFINDVTVTRDGAWFTDSVNPTLYFIPISHGTPGAVRTLALSGPAADITGDFNLNGIAATENGKTLVVAHSANSAIYTVDPDTGASAAITGVNVPNADGIILDGHRLWVVQNFTQQISEFRLDGHLTRGTLVDVITSPAFATPSTAARFGDKLAVVNAHFDTGVPPTAPQYEVVVTRS